MVKVEIFTHTHIETGGIFFEEGDFRITSISDGEYISKSDFDALFELIMSLDEIDINELLANRWYFFTVKRSDELDNESLFYIEETGVID